MLVKVVNHIDCWSKANRLCWKAIILTMLFALGGGVKAQQIIPITESIDFDYIGENVSIYQDTSSKLTIKEIINAKSYFKKNNNLAPNFGVSPYNNWINFKLVNHSTNKKLYLNISNSLIDQVTFYEINKGNIVSQSINARDLPSNRRIEHQFFNFELNLPKGDTVEYYLKVESTKQIIVPLVIADVRSLARESLGFNLRSGVFIGLMLAMLLYNLFLFISVKDRHYLAYLHYIFWVSVAQVAILGYFQQFLNFSFLSKGNFIASVGAMSGIASVLFVKSFLNVKHYSTKLDKWLNVIIIGDVFALILLFIGKPQAGYQLVNIVAGLGSIIVLIVSISIYRKGNKSGKLFLIAWGIFLSSVIVYVLKDYGILEYNLLTAHAVQIGASIEALLLSFALGDKINIYRREKELSQERELVVSKENATLIREQNIVLEQRVHTRTKELREANNTLQKTLNDLKEAQSQLVEAEKMASLGQLTAGVAHEINNPINFVTSNVGPLKRDIKMLWDALDEIERVAYLENEELSSRKAIIQSYKEELDIDYLRTEIEYLLNGMHDGANRTAEIVKSLRIFSRVDEDSLKMANINEGLESTLVILNSLISGKITVNKNLENLPLVECYPGKLNQVFLNILTNAIYAIDKKYENNIGGELIIETGIDDTEDHVFIKITDNGIGIPEAIKNKIFDPFFTTKDVGEGTGLGMSIAYNTIAKHQGKILVDTQLGEGTTFNLILPIIQRII